MSTRRARVVVAYATVKVLDPISGGWSVRGFYQDAILPAEADPENVASLVRRQYAEWLDEAEGEAVERQEADADEAQDAAFEKRLDEAEAAVKRADEPERVEPVEIESDPDDGAEVVSAPGIRPAQAAPKADWVTYAVALRAEGVSEQDAKAAAEAKTKAELVAEFGG